MACSNFEASKPGTRWAGMPCKNCSDKFKDHKVVEVKKEELPSPWAAGRELDDFHKARDAKKKIPVKSTPKRYDATRDRLYKRPAGTTEGSLAFMVGKALKVKHTGSSSGMTKQRLVDKEETRMYHQNKAANKDMAKTFAAMVMSANKDTKVGRYVSKKREALPKSERRRSVVAEGATEAHLPKWKPDAKFDDVPAAKDDSKAADDNKAKRTDPQAGEEEKLTPLQMAKRANAAEAKRAKEAEAEAKMMAEKKAKKQAQKELAAKQKKEKEEKKKEEAAAKKKEEEEAAKKKEDEKKQKEEDEKKQEEDEKKQKEMDEKKQKEEDEKKQKEEDEKKKQEEDEKKKQEEAKKEADEVAQQKAEADAEQTTEEEGTAEGTDEEPEKEEGV